MLRPTLFVVLCSFLLLNTASALNMKEYAAFVKKMLLNDTLVKEYDNHIKRILEIEPNYFDYNPYNSYLEPFNCPSIPPSPVVNSVHELRPSDIKAVGALGDSLTAALGASCKSIIGLLFENRGESWSIGGDQTLESRVTMTNILRKFQPNLVGTSTGSDFILLDLFKSAEGFNVAISGQEANHIPDQARELVARMKNSKDFDYLNDWKLITLFVGGNDLCDFCKDAELHTPEAYINYLREGLDILFKELPKTFVNLVTVLRVNEVKFLNEGLICNLLHRFECPCAAFPENADEEKKLEETFDQYVNYTFNLVNSNRYERDDFTVVIQPFMEEMKIPRTPKGKVDLSYFGADCFHFSRKGHTQAAIALWNNMLTPVNQKATSWNIEEQILCPDVNQPFLCTRKNCGF